MANIMGTVTHSINLILYSFFLKPQLCFVHDYSIVNKYLIMKYFSLLLFILIIHSQMITNINLSIIGY